MYMLKLYRLEIQAKVRHLGRNPGTTAQQSNDSARKQLTALVHELKRKPLAACVVEVHSSTCRTVQEPLGMWDEVVNEPMPGGPAQGDLTPAIDEPASTGATPIENQMLPLPSNENVGQEHAPLELSYQIQHVKMLWNRIVCLIAEKSFQFSHVIRVAPREDVNTRSRAEVKKLNLKISVHCRLYTQCRARLISLG